MREFTVSKNREHTHIYIRVMLEEEAKNPHRIEGNKKYNFWEDIKYIQCI
jgi:hypothetical protein